MIVRKIEEKDIPKILKIGLVTSEFNISDNGNFWGEEELKNWISSPDDLCLVAEESGHILGFSLSSVHIPTGKVTLENIWVNSDKRGKGVGRKLIEETISSLKNLGYEYICAFVKENNVNQDFFEKMDFKFQEKGCWVDRII